MAIFGFDLDGTIFNSSSGVYKSLQFACSKNKIDLIEETKFSKKIGPPLKNYIRDIIDSKIDERTIHKLLKEFRYHHDHQGYKFYTIYPNVLSTLKELCLKGNKLFVLTNKPYFISQKSIQFFKLNSYFDQIYAQDKSTDKTFLNKDIQKNHKEIYLSFIAEKFNIQEKLFYVGDTNSDYLATTNNSFEFIFASYGYGEIKEQFGNIKILNNFADLNYL